MNLSLPLKGVSDVLASSEAPNLTTRRMVNMLGVDCTTKQIRLAMRQGTSKALEDTVAGDYPVRALAKLTFHRRTVLYQDKASSITAPLGSADVKWSAVASSKRAVLAGDTDRQGNVYTIDGLAGIEIRNSAGELQRKIALPVKSAAAQVRALVIATVGFVGDLSDAIYSGVSSGGLQSDARMYCHRQISSTDDEGEIKVKPELVWEFQPNAYVERMRERNGLLYTAQNEPDKGRSWVRIYYNIGAAAPDLAREFEIPYPVNDLDVRADDGAILTAHPPNLLRGRDPRNPTYTARDLANEWLLHDLTDIGKRGWTDVDAEFLPDQFGLEDGDSVEAVLDQFPMFRSLFQATAANQPIYVENGIGGRPAIRFNGAAPSANTPILVTEPNPSTATQFDDQQRTLFPGYLGARYIAFVVMRPANDATIRPAIRQDNEAAGALAAADLVAINKDSTTAVATTGAFSGKVALLTQTDGTNGPGAGTLSNTPFAADYVHADSTGTVILTFLYDGNALATTDQAQHSLLRANGRPVDRWTSLSSIGLGATTVGGPGGSALTTYLQGDVARILVFREYTTGGVQGNPMTGAFSTVGATGSFHYPRTLGAMAASAGIAYEAIAGNRYNDNEIERVEGMLAGKYGIAHILPCGTAAKLVFAANLNNNDTVTIDGVVYTAKAALTGSLTAYEFLIGANARTTAINLFRCINQTGVHGTDYGGPIVAHTTCAATAINNESATAPIIKIETKGLTAVAVAESTATVRMAWNVATTTSLATVCGTTAAYMPGHYPHPFNIHFGFPRPDVGAVVGSTLESKGKMLNSTEGIMARWDPNGKLAWVLTSRLATVTPGGTLPVTDQKFGGVGYACAFGTTTGIYSAGPMYSTAPGSQSEQAAIRRVVDNTTTVAVTGTGTWALTPALIASAGANDSINYQYPRIAVDTFDNVYLPYDEYDATGNMSLVCIKASGVVSFTWRLNSSTSNPQGACVFIGKKNPDYDGDPATRAFDVFLGTRLGRTVDDATQATLYCIQPVNVTSLSIPPTQTRLCAVANGEFWTSLNGAAFTEPSGTSTLTNPVLDTDPPFVSMATLFGEVFMTDGRTYRVYNARRDTLLALVAEKGELKSRAKLVCAWRGRLVWARFADSPHEYLMSRLGEPLDYDILPPTQDATQAILGSRSPKGTGQAPDIINGLVPISDDRLLFICESSLWILDGDPMDGGRFWNVSDSTGGSFGRAWCRDEYGTVYIMGSRGCVYAFDAGGLRPLSDNAIPERLRAIDFSTHRAELAWSSEMQGFHLFLIPVDSVGVVREHYFWSRKLEGWYPESFSNADHAPMCVVTADGDSSETRAVTIGCADGYLRSFDSTANDDDGSAILAYAFIGPLQPKEERLQTHFKELRAVLASSQGGCGYKGYAMESPDVLGAPAFTGTLNPGRNPLHYVQALARHVAIEVSNAAVGNRFAVESIEMQAYPGGQ